MAKQTQRVECLKQWLRDRKVETGLTKKPKKEEDTEHFNYQRSNSKLLR